jgi:type I protein arginine methyltransferase
MKETQQDDWSESDDENSSDPAKKIKALEEKLAQSQAEFARYREAVTQKLDFLQSDDPSASGSGKERDDDTHYFDSYGQNDIHAVMIQDRVRTSTYAQFILTNPALFTDAVVLDVGCGTGILSLFAARAGARKVYAVDASDIADRAREIVKRNNMDHIVEVIKGKVENIQIPEKVDIIISEWMGYALLYESMLDSVLKARDRFLKTEKDIEEDQNPGVMAPSQCQMMLGLCDGSEIVKDRISFWNDVYGMSLDLIRIAVY